MTRLVWVTRLLWQLCDQVDELLQAGRALSEETQHWRLLAEKYRSENDKLSGALLALKAERPMKSYQLWNGRTFRKGKPRPRPVEPDPDKRRKKMLRQLDRIFQKAQAARFQESK